MCRRVIKPFQAITDPHMDAVSKKHPQCFERAARASDPAYQRIDSDLAVQWLAWAAEIDGRGIVDPAILPPAAQRRRA
jgi:hypothetical protein